MAVSELVLVERGAGAGEVDGPRTQSQLRRSSLAPATQAKQRFHVRLPCSAHLLPTNTVGERG